MLTDKEKKIGIIMLICSAVAVILLIVIKIFTAKGSGIHGSGVSDGGENVKVVPVSAFSTIFYETDLGESRYGCSLSQPAMLGVYADMIHEVDSAVAVTQEQTRQQDLEAQQERMETPIDHSNPSGLLADMAYAINYADVEGDALAFDTKSMTGSAAPLSNVVSEASLALCGIYLDYSNMNRVRAFKDGALADGNSVRKLYSEVLSANYAEGTYCAYIATADSFEHIGGNELLILLLGGVSADDVAKYIADGETLDGLVDSGKVSLETAVAGGVSYFHNAYELCNIGYDAGYVETFGASEQLIVVHLVSGQVYVENYAVGNLVGVSTEEDPEAGGFDPDSGEYFPGVKEVEIPVFKGYYCW